MEGSELRLQLDTAQREYSSALAAAHAAADARAAEKDKQIATQTSDLSRRQLLQQAAEERAADQQKQAAALQQQLEQALIAVQQAESQAGEVQKERLAWAQEREELHRALESARASCSEQVQKLLGREESAKAQALQMQQLQLDLQRQCDEAAHAQREAQRMGEQVAHGLNQLQCCSLCTLRGVIKPILEAFPLLALLQTWPARLE